MLGDNSAMFTAARLALVDFLAGEEACDIIPGQDSVPSTRDTMIPDETVPGVLMSQQGKEEAAAALRQQHPHATMGEATHAGVKICEISGSQATLATAALARVLLTRGASSSSASDSSPGEPRKSLVTS